MENDIAKKIQARFEELPDDVQKAVQSADLDKHIQEIGQKYQLHIDQLEVLEDETYLVMLGFSNPDEFVQHIKERIHIEDDKAENIANDIGSQIFMPIRNSMQEFSDEQSLLSAATEIQSSGPLASTDTVSEHRPAVTPATQAPRSVFTPMAPQSPAPLQNPTPPTTSPKPAITPMKAPDLHPAEVVMHEKTVQIAPPAKPQTPNVPPTEPADSVPAKPVPPKPQPYKADPYREPVE